MLALQAVTILSVALACCQHARALSFWDSQFSTSEFAQYRYLNLLTVSVFQHLNKNSTFYITPLVLLDHRSGVLRYNTLTDFHELRLKVLMWDPELQDSVKSYLTTEKGIAKPEVKMLPMEKVRFDWRSRSRPLRRGIVMETEFIATHHLPRYLTLTFACKNRADCDDMHKQVRQHPEALDSLVIDCLMAAQRAATKTITVTMESLAQTETFSKLLSLPADGNYKYMRVEDLNTLAQEAYSSVRASTVRSSEYVDKYDELNIVKLIQDSLRQDEVLTSSLTESQWGSVFWEPTFTRPDKVVREASKTFTKNATTNRLEVNHSYLGSSESARKLFAKDHFKAGLKVGVSTKTHTRGEEIEGAEPPSTEILPDLELNVDGSLEVDGSRKDDSSKKSSGQASFSGSQLNDLLAEANLQVQWEGERFVVKPVRLVRLNQRAFRSRRELVSRNLQITVYQQSLSLKVIIRPAHNQTWLIPEVSRPAGFPTDFSYCLLSNGGACPPGFNRSSGFIKGINMDTTSEMISTARLGDSAIKCHSPADNENNCAFRGWDPYKGELHLHVCCR